MIIFQDEPLRIENKDTLFHLHLGIYCGIKGFSIL